MKKFTFIFSFFLISSMLISQLSIGQTVDVGPDRLIGTTSINLAGTTTAPGSPTFLWTKTSGPAGHTFTTPALATTTVNGLVQGTYVFRLTVNGTIYDELTVTVIPGTNLWATSSSGNQVSSFTVSGTTYTSGPINMFVPTGGASAALGRSSSPSQTAGYFYWMPNDFSGNDGVFNLYGSTATGNNKTLIATYDLNGGSGADMGFVRLAFDGSGTGWIFARSENNANTLYLASFVPNGVNPTSITVVDNNVSLVGGTNSTFFNGDICFSSNGTMFALANNGSQTQIFSGLPNGSSTTLTKRWDLEDQNGNAFNGSVNGVAFDISGGMYISTSSGLYYIDQWTVNNATGTVTCALVWSGSGLTDLASNVFPSTILLPVKLGDFSVVKNGNNALLKWVTSSEFDVSHFEIERSYDGINFTTVGNKQATGNSASDISYDFSDPISVSSGIIYYRLKSLDIDGKASYSKIVSLKLNGGFVKRFTTYPNPFTSNLKVELNADQSEVVNLRISNATGQVVLNKNISVQKGSNVIVLSSEIANLKPGIHIVEISSASGKFSEKVIKH